MAVQRIDELDLPLLDTVDLDRVAALEAASAIGEEHWLARTDVGIALLHYEDVTSILRDRRFHSALSKIPEMAGIDDVGQYFKTRRRSILSTEGEEHTRLRRLVSPAFTPGAADRHRPVMRQVLADLIEPHLATGRVELVGEVCEPYPIPIICEVLGAPKEDWRRFSAWATDIFRLFNGNLVEDLSLIQAASEELQAYVEALVEERRDSPGDDLLSDLIAAEEEGDRLSNAELSMLAEAVLMAGTDTTRNQLGCTMALFAQRPDDWAALRADPTRIARAVEETMRYLGAVRATVRVASCDVEYRDVLIPEGTFITTHLGAANRDASVFDDPSSFDIAAPREVEQMTFGSGIHRCLGAALARAELQEALLVLVERFETVSLEGPVTWKPSSTGIWGPSSLPLRFEVDPAFT